MVSISQSAEVAAPSVDIDMWTDKRLLDRYPLWAQLREAGPLCISVWAVGAVALCQVKGALRRGDPTACRRRRRADNL